MLVIDINLKEGKKEKVCIFDGDTARDVAAIFCFENNLDESIQRRLEGLIEGHMSNLLMKIDEENAVSEEKSIINEI